MALARRHFKAQLPFVVILLCAACAHPAPPARPAVRPTGSIRGRIVGEDGSSRPGVAVRAEPWLNRSSVGRPARNSSRLQTISEPNGAFAIEGVPDGSWMLVAGGRKHEVGGWINRYVVTAGSSLEGVTVVLHPMRMDPAAGESASTYTATFPIDEAAPEIQVVGRAMARTLAGLDAEAAARLSPAEFTALVEHEIRPEELTPEVRAVLDSMRENGPFEPNPSAP